MHWNDNIQKVKHVLHQQCVVCLNITFWIIVRSSLLILGFATAVNNDMLWNINIHYGKQGFCNPMVSTYSWAKYLIILCGFINTSTTLSPNPLLIKNWLEQLWTPTEGFVHIMFTLWLYLYLGIRFSYHCLSFSPLHASQRDTGSEKLV